MKIAVSVDRTRDLQIFSLTLSQLSYPRKMWRGSIMINKYSKYEASYTGRVN